MDSMQRNLVQSHITALAAEAADERLAAAARNAGAGARKPSIRSALGHQLMTLGATIAAAPKVDDPCAEGGAAQGV